MLHRCSPQWTWKNLSPRTLYVAMKHLALPFKELLDDPYLSYKEPIEPVDPYDPYRARLLKPPVAKQSPFGRLFTAAEVTESVSDGQLLGASMASYEDHEATARLAVQAIIKKLKINADEFTFTRNYSTQRSPLVEILDTDLKGTSVPSTNPHASSRTLCSRFPCDMLRLSHGHCGPQRSRRARSRACRKRTN